MLRELHISGLGVIDDLDLEVHPGLTVLTGETGAGKTMVTVGLSLALGARGSASLVRSGAKAARVQARFDAPVDAGEWAEDGEVVLARTVSADGKSAARIGGQIATASALADLGASLVEVHGQHQAQRLLAAATQTAFLDRFAGDAHLVGLAGYREVFDRLRDARIAAERLREAARDRERELDLLAYQVREIEAIAPKPGETEALEAEEARLSHVERLIDEAGSAEAVLAGDEGAADALGAAAHAAEAVASMDPAAGGLAERAGSLAAEAAELARDLREYREGLAADPTRLQEVRERVQALKALRRKYGETDADVLGFLAEAADRLTTLTTADDRLAELAAEVEALEANAGERAATVSRARRVAAPALAAAITTELEELGMPGAALEVALDALPEPGPSGAERAELRLSAGPGQSALPLAKAASGGELSRTMLACRSVLADLDEVPTLVFDEVDAGIGGRAGLAVGRRLARLARDRQVLVVTHLPQIACFADRHVRVSKDTGTATIEALDDHERIVELSRMLAGLDGSEAAEGHAEELLTEAERVKAGA
ncbi:MAG: DNA repair protein RecN [Actinomycetota bacterium]